MVRMSAAGIAMPGTGDGLTGCVWRRGAAHPALHGSYSPV